MEQPTRQAIDTTRWSGRVAVVTDSVATVPAAVARELGIVVVPFWVHIDAEDFRDGIDLQPAELYRRMREEHAIPKTSQPTVAEYCDAFRLPLQSGPIGVVYVGLSSERSGANNGARAAAAELAREFPDPSIVVVDSRIAAISEGFLAIAGARSAAAGSALDEVVRVVEAARRRVGLIAALDTLEYLQRGGRIGPAPPLLGGILSVKPIITIDEAGTIGPVARVRTMRAALEYMVDRVGEAVAGAREVHIGVVQSDAYAEAERLQERVIEALHPTEVFITDFTIVMGAHTGPGVIGLGYYFA